jgi:phosphoglycerol transferase MdoB-like AlkP superfamily enzyme
MRAAGYLTICLHPFDRTFYRRDLVMPNLGFDIFLGEEAFAGAKRNGLYIADAEVARVAVELMAKHREPIFLFAITMENHGPWRGQAEPGVPDVAPNQASVSGTSALGRFIWGTRGADAMLGILSDALATRDDPGVLALYGDHPPSFPDAFRTLGFADRRTDYFIWHGGGGEALRQDLAAHELSAAILAALSQRKPATVEEK